MSIINFKVGLAKRVVDVRACMCNYIKLFHMDGFSSHIINTMLVQPILVENWAPGAPDQSSHKYPWVSSSETIFRRHKCCVLWWLF